MALTFCILSISLFGEVDYENVRWKVKGLLPEVTVDVLDILDHQLGIPGVLDVNVLNGFDSGVLRNSLCGSFHGLDLRTCILFVLALPRHTRLQGLLEGPGVLVGAALAAGVLDLAKSRALQIRCA